MPDYHNGSPEGWWPGRRIKILEDRDGEGRCERATMFADGTLFANGVLLWRDEAIVTSAPEVVFLGEHRRRTRSIEEAWTSALTSSAAPSRRSWAWASTA